MIPVPPTTKWHFITVFRFKEMQRLPLLWPHIEWKIMKKTVSMVWLRVVFFKVQSAKRLLISAPINTNTTTSLTPRQWEGYSALQKSTQASKQKYRLSIEVCVNGTEATLCQPRFKQCSRKWNNPTSLHYLNSKNCFPLCSLSDGGKVLVDKRLEKNGSNVMRRVKTKPLEANKTRCVCVSGLDMQIGKQIERGTSSLKPKWLPPSITPRARTSPHEPCLSLRMFRCVGLHFTFP